MRSWSGLNRALDVTWSVRSSTSFTISSRGRRFVGACGRAGVEEVSLPFASEVMPLVAVGLFGGVAGSPGRMGEVFVTLSVLLR